MSFNLENAGKILEERKQESLKKQEDKKPQVDKKEVKTEKERNL